MTYQENLLPSYNINLKLAETLLRHRIDIAFATVKGNSPTMQLLAYMSGAKERVSHSVNLWTPLVTELAVRLYGSHTADITMSCVEHLIKARIGNRKLEAWFTPLDIGKVQAVMPSARKLYAIGLGGGKAIAHYPPESYAQLINMLIRADESVHFIIVGGSEDVEAASILMANVDQSRVLSLVGKISYRQTAAALSLCNMYIGNDTGALHLAAAVGLPVLSANCFPRDLIRPGIVLNHWYPYEVPSVIVCPSHALPECADSPEYFGCRADHPHCITQITPQNLFYAYKLLLERIAEGNTEPLIIGTT